MSASTSPSSAPPPPAPPLSSIPPRPKSPPLAFERTPNDALIAPAQSSSYGDSLTSPPAMGRTSPLTPPSGTERELHAIIEKQANALRKAHESFAEERHAWYLERKSLKSQISRLEQHIKPGDHWSPAKSPIMSPSSAADITSPTARAASQTLPTIAEDENLPSLSFRRQNAPASIDIPTINTTSADSGRRKSSVSFTTEAGVLVEEFAVSPPHDNLSPLPPNNRAMAGHTPVRAPHRPPTPPPANMSMDGIEDTPTRNNTHINTLLVQSSDEEEDRELKGPLNMPELPNQPNESNFTLEALNKKLEHLMDHPEDSKPMVFSEPSPGLASPASPREELSPRSQARSLDSEVPLAPIGTRASIAPSDLSSNALSPANGAALSPQEVHEAKVQAEFENGGIKLKKKTSVNFGAPFGSLGGFGHRRSSADKS